MVAPYFVEAYQNPRVNDTARPLKEIKLAPNSPAALDRVKALLKNWDMPSERLLEVTEAQQRYADDQLKLNQFSVGDKVCLSTKNLTTASHSNKIDNKLVGLFSLLNKFRPQAYQLNLLKNSRRIHSIINVSFLQ